MLNFFIIPKGTYETTNWKASSFCDVCPRIIKRGPHAGSYAVNTAIFESDPSFEKYRELLNQFPTSSLNDGDDLVLESEQNDY